eukprot:21948-Pelagococcus_subviridis.AAC.3
MMSQIRSLRVLLDEPTAIASRHAADASAFSRFLLARSRTLAHRAEMAARACSSFRVVPYKAMSGWSSKASVG